MPLPPAVPRRRWLRAWLPVGLGLGMAAAAALLVTLSREEPAGVAHVQVTADGTLPPAGVELLSAQAALARQDQEGQHFEAQMQAYRQQMFRSLEASYPMALSALVADPRSSR